MLRKRPLNLKHFLFDLLVYTDMIHRIQIYMDLNRRLVNNDQLAECACW